MTASSDNPQAPSLGDYPAWHKTKFQEDLNEQSSRIWYSLNAQGAKATLESHAAAASIEAVLQKLKADGTLARNQPAGITFQIKPYSSVIDKLFRLNCNWNRRFPNTPKKGWAKLSEIFGRFDDIIRTSVVCFYIDGPARVCAEIVAAAKTAGLKAEESLKATNEGYYAHHIILEFEFEALDKAGAGTRVTTKAEIQVITQMQDVLREMTHPYYQQRRIKPPPENETASKWDFKSQDFRTTYLGHTLHLIESLVAELRVTSNDSTEQAPPQAENMEQS